LLAWEVDSTVAPTVSMSAHNDESNSTSASQRPPVSLGRQQLLFSVGHGGMSDVYLALVNSAVGVNKLLVVKQLRASLLDDPEALSMFMDEARLATRLHHPNVVQTYDVGQEGPIPYITMEFLDGQPLHRVLRRLGSSADEGLEHPTPALTLGMRLCIITEMLEGLQYAHELVDYDDTPLNVVHRDVSPQNLFITYDGQIKLVDFGIAKANASITQTEGHGLKGKLAYMSPQQAAGEVVDRRTDVFAAGVMLWELLSGRRLWAGCNEATIARRLVDHDLPALELDGVPARLLEICRTALAPALERRYPTAESFRVAIEQYMRDEGLETRMRAIGTHVAQAFAHERAEVRSRIDQELRGQVAGAGLADSPIPLWRDRYRSESTDRTLGSDASDASACPDEVTADYGPRLLDAVAPESSMVEPPLREASRTIGVQSAMPPSRHMRRLWPLFGTLALGLVLVIPALRTDDEDQTETPSPITEPPLTPQSPAMPSACDVPLRDKPRVVLTGDIDHDSTLHCDRSYVLTFTTRVTGGATLTIEPGTTILGDRQTRGTLVVEPGSRLIADGTPERPIVFTSASPEPERRPGDWGGLLLLGDAPINLRDANGRPMRGQVEGLSEVSRYGGNDVDDDSGVLRYVRIEYPGAEVAPANESNGLTLAGVGRATIIDHVAVHASADDCFEFFGGTVDARHLVCEAPGDDGLDFDLGYQGRIQFVVVSDLALADPHSDTPSNAFELDNDPNGTNAEPRTRPLIWNATLCGVSGGASPSYAVLVRRAATAELHGVIAGGFDFALDVRDSSSFELSGIGLLTQPGAELGERDGQDDDDGFDEIAWLAEPQRAMVHELAGIIGCGGPMPASLIPTSAIVPIAGFVGPPDDGFFDTTAAWVGAFGPGDDWTAGWVSWREP
jgi:serine/threonine protein kinase